MANAPIREIANHTNLDVQLIERFLISVAKYLKADGTLYENAEIFVPGINKTATLLGGDRSAPPTEYTQNQNDYLLYADLVQMLGQVAEWYLVNNDVDPDAKKQLSNWRQHVLGEKHGLLTYAVGTENIDKDVIVQQNFVTKVLPLVNDLLIAASIDNADQTKEMFNESEYVNETDLEPTPSPTDTDTDSGGRRAGGGGGTPPGETDQDDSDTDTTETPSPKTEPPIHGFTLKELSRAETDVAFVNATLRGYLFTHHDIPPEFLADYLDLEKELYEHVRGIYFNSPSKMRTQIFSQARTSLPTDFLLKVQSLYEAYALTLPEQKRTSFIDSANQTLQQLGQPAALAAGVTSLFKKDLAEILGTDSPATLSSVKTAVESMVINYGVPLEIAALNEDGTLEIKTISGNQEDALWVIQNLPAGYIQLIFGIPAEISLTTEQVEELKQLLTRYAKERATELALSAHSDAIAKGFNTLDAAELAGIKIGDQKIITRKLQATIVATGQTINASSISGEDSGAEIISKALTNDVKDQTKRQYGVWNSLALDEERKKLIYTYLGVNVDDVTDYSVPPENLHLFNIMELSLIVEEQVLAQQAIHDAQLLALAQLQQEIIVEEQIRQFYTQAYLNQVTQAEQAEMMAHLELEHQHELEQMSLSNLVGVNEQILDENYTPKTSGFAGSRRGSSRFRQILNRQGGAQLTPRDRAAKLLKDKAQNQLMNHLDKAAIAGGPWTKAAVMAAKVLTDEKKRKMVLGGALALGGAAMVGLANLLNMAKSAGWMAVGGGALGVGGAILLGAGPVGWLVGGLIGAGVGIGAALTGNGISNPFASSSLTRPYADPYATTSPASSTTATAAKSSSAAAAAETLIGLPVAIAAPAGALLLFVLTSAYVLFIIQSAFLVPLPTGFGGSYTDGFDNFEGCWPTTGETAGYLTYVNLKCEPGDKCIDGRKAHAVWQDDSLGYPGPGEAIDIMTDGNSSADTKFPAVYSPYSGTANFYLDAFNNTGYGNYVVIDTGQFALIFAHMRNFTPEICEKTSGFANDEERVACQNSRRNVSITAGDLLGNVDNTGNSYGNHLHYEVVGASLLDIVPLTDQQKQTIAADETKFAGMDVSPKDCEANQLPGPAIDITGYVAMGEPTAANIVTTDASLVSTPQFTCDWHNAQGLAASINGNFYNTPTQPIGLGGSNPVQYFANAANRGGPDYMEINMTAFVTNTQGASIIPIQPSWFNASSFPIALTQFGDAVTGLTRYTSDDADIRRKTAVGLGISNGNCGPAGGGQKVFLAAIPQGEWSQLRAVMQHCGATDYVFMDAGTSAAFCSNQYTLPGGRAMPVNIGLKSAEVTQFTITTSGVSED